MAVLEQLRKEASNPLAVLAMLGALLLPSCGRKDSASEGDRSAVSAEALALPDSFGVALRDVRTGSGNWTAQRAMQMPEAYSCDNIWYHRLGYLERMCVLNDSGAKGKIPELLIIRGTDDDARVRELAGEMLKSLRSTGDLSETTPYREKVAEDVRLSLKLDIENPYNPRAIWYERADQLTALANAYSDKTPPDWVGRDLRKIAGKDDDWRIADFAQRLGHALEQNGSLAGVTF